MSQISYATRQSISYQYISVRSTMSRQTDRLVKNTGHRRQNLQSIKRETKKNIQPGQDSNLQPSDYGCNDTIRILVRCVVRRSAIELPGLLWPLLEEVG